MLPPDEGFRADIAGRMEHVGSEEELLGVLGEIEQRISEAVRLRPKLIRPVAQKLQVSGQPDWLETQIERRPSR
jgi:hypothetical protein